MLALPCVTNCPAALDDDDVPKTDYNWSDPLTWPQGRLPLDGDTLFIPADWALHIDINITPLFEEIVVMGHLVFVDGIGDITLRAKRIWVRGGNIIAGSLTKRFESNIRIELYGIPTD